MTTMTKSKTCMNRFCGGGGTMTSTSATRSFKPGWPLRSGGFADLCHTCGSAYEQSIYCDVFHSSESGWRECSSCGKRLHCGCVASRFLLVLHEAGGVNCISCSTSSGVAAVSNGEKTDASGLEKVERCGEMLQLVSGDIPERNLMQSGNHAACSGTRHFLQLKNDDDMNVTFRPMKHEDNSLAVRPETCKATLSANELYESLAQTNLSITLGSPLRNPSLCPGTVDERVQDRTSSPLQHGSRSRHLLPKPPKSVLASGLQTTAGMVSQMRVARPPGEGRGKNQLLPRYWPRITDQELQQISGDSNSTVVPLFEKVLSASDAGRIGRLVLPKACAEAYFPPISQPEGLPIRIQDVKGKEWVFQFRFWPNNNSRMYVLEGVTPCIQSMQLQAGDTVIFSRMDPEGKLIMGFRKASNPATVQDMQQSAIPTGVLSNERFFSGVFDNLPVMGGYLGLLQSLKGNPDAHLSAIKKNEDQTREDLLFPSLLTPERKRTRNIGSKSKRLLIDTIDSLELKLTWEEAQDLLCPPPSVKPSIFTVDEHDLEEYEEPPVFGKRSIFAIRSTGGQEQWTECDACSKWRRLPIDVILPPKWTCMDNAWDQSRCSCSAPEELTPSELENLLRLNQDFRKRRLVSSPNSMEDHKPSGLDALANAVVLGDMSDPTSTTAVATTTKHPRHRPGCSCIVCIQPPSGKGKHKPTCTCQVCMTVKRRFKTLMMRKKKRQSEREAEIIAQRNQQSTCGPKDETVEAADSSSNNMLLGPTSNNVEKETKSASELDSKGQSNTLPNNGKGPIDLNSDPDHREGDDLREGLPRMSMMSLLQVASLPLDTYLKQNGLTSLASEQERRQEQQEPSSPSNMLSTPTQPVHEDCEPALIGEEQESSAGDQENYEAQQEQSENNEE